MQQVNKKDHLKNWSDFLPFNIFFSKIRKKLIMDDDNDKKYRSKTAVEQALFVLFLWKEGIFPFFRVKKFVSIHMRGSVLYGKGRKGLSILEISLMMLQNFLFIFF